MYLEYLYFLLLLFFKKRSYRDRSFPVIVFLYTEVFVFLSVSLAFLFSFLIFLHVFSPTFSFTKRACVSGLH